MDSLLPQTRVLLWTAPRCLSSAFERSVRELSSVKVLYEPYQGSYYYGPQKMTDEVLSSEIKSKYAKYTYDFVDSMLLDNYKGFSAVFAKNMAYFFSSDRLPCYLKGKFSNFKHTFLIRNPHQTHLSLWKICKKIGYDFPGFERDGYPKLYEFFKLVQDKLGEVIVIDADDLLSNPEAIMEQYCQRTGLPYHKDMLTWTPGIVEDWTTFEFYKEFHWNAMYSSGFEKKVSPTEFYPPEVQREIERDIQYYETMYEHRIRLP